MTQATREQQAAALQKDWNDNPRWKGIERGYTAADVVGVVALGGLAVAGHAGHAGTMRCCWLSVNKQRRVDSLSPFMRVEFLNLVQCSTPGGT